MTQQWGRGMPWHFATLGLLTLFAVPAAAQAPGGAFVETSAIERVRVRLDSTSDRFTGRWSVGGHDLKTLSGGASLITKDVSFNIVRTGSAELAPFYYVRIIYRGYGWAFLNGRVQFLVDGTDRLEIEGPGSEREREVSSSCVETVGCIVTEGERIPLPGSVLVRLASANSVEVRVVGERQSFERGFKKEHHALARTLLLRFGHSPDGVSVDTSAAKP